MLCSTSFIRNTAMRVLAYLSTIRIAHWCTPNMLLDRRGFLRQVRYATALRAVIPHAREISDMLR